MNIKNTAHFVMQSKGGAGKSVVSALLSQYLLEHDKDLILIDTDPSNKTLGSYKGLNVQKIEVLNKNKLVDQSKFDGFMNDFLANNHPMLVDTGSGDFLAINNYILNNEIVEIFRESNKQLLIHVPVNFGQSKDETLKCLYDISLNHNNANIIIWENEFFGENTDDALAVFLKKLKNIAGVIKIREMNSDTERADFSRMLQQSLTFNEVKVKTDDPNFGFIQKTRLERIRKEIWGQLDDLFDPTKLTIEAE
ncbi:hypothetical protein ACF3NV_10410 (plasmid) [Moraxella atlantae]|uniref:nucleotide-binding protein n=1 Tax=Faucicola atlantae TaxID=34059 RepID=UPI003752978B